MGRARPRSALNWSDVLNDGCWCRAHYWHRGTVLIPGHRCSKPHWRRRDVLKDRCWCSDRCRCTVDCRHRRHVLIHGRKINVRRSWCDVLGFSTICSTVYFALLGGRASANSSWFLPRYESARSPLSSRTFSARRALHQPTRTQCRPRHHDSEPSKQNWLKTSSTPSQKNRLKTTSTPFTTRGHVAT